MGGSVVLVDDVASLEIGDKVFVHYITCYCFYGVFKGCSNSRLGIYVERGDCLSVFLNNHLPGRKIYRIEDDVWGGQWF